MGSEKNVTRQWLSVAGVVVFAGACVTSAGHLRLTQSASQAKPVVAARKITPEALRLNTLGVAYLNQGKSADAQKYFEQALAADKDFAQAQSNLGIALLAQQKLDQARAALEEATSKLPDDPYAWYNLGLAYKDMSEPEKAISAFQHVEKIVPDEPDAYYFEGFLQSQLQRYDQAIAAFQKALEIAPYHASAQFGLARAYQRKGESDLAREGMKHFQKLTSEHLGTPFGAGYGDQGRYSLAEFVHGSESQAPPEIAVHYTHESLDKRTSGGGNAGIVGASQGACFFDFDGDGKTDLFLVGAEGKSQLLRNVGGGRFEDVSAKAGLAGVGAGFGCAAGDFDNDGWTDLAVCEVAGVRLFHNDGGGKFTDVTRKVGIRREKGCVAAAFVDYDHDGDLDLYLTMSADSAANGAKPKNKLWRNNGNFTFTDVSEESGLGVDATGGGVSVTDFNNDRAIDFVLAGGSGGAAIYLNPREGKFSLLPAIDFAKENLPPAVGVTVFDFDKDGWMDLAFTHAGAPGISLWRNAQGKKLERVPLPDFGWKQGWGVTWVDLDNDGWLDLAAVGEGANGGELRLLRNLGYAGWADVSKKTEVDGLPLNQPRTVAVADLKGDGSPDLVITEAVGTPIVLTNIGANRNHWMQVDLKALNDNKSSIGTKVELYAGALYQKFEIPSSSGLGQSSGALLAGLGSEKIADAVRLLWPTGVPQDEVDLAANKIHSIAELDRRGSSCPILFSWNGKEYEFVADMIGPGVVGHWIAPGERDVPDPDEYLKVPAKSTQPKNGLLSFRFMEPMEETVYLDQVRLVAVDHPAKLEVNPNERFVSNPPFPEFRVVTTENAQMPAGAWDEHGHSVLPVLAKRDRKYVTGFEDLPFAGFAKLHWIELDLGNWDPQQPLRLLLDGYTDYFTATSMYAADQAGIKVIAPYVEVRDSHGKWVRVVEDMGFPAGLARTMVTDLTGKIPPGTRRIRIVTNLKIYWDRVRIDQTPGREDVIANEVPLAAAELAFLGYPREIRLHPASDTVYSYTHRSPTGPYARAAGNYTRYGDVKELLSAADDKFGVFGSGEGVKLEFDPAKLPPLPSGWVRDYFFYANGFEKDLDFYAAYAFTVEPLPKHGLISYPYAGGKEYPLDDDHLQYQLEYNTRPRSDRMPEKLRYEYPPPE